MLKAITVKDEVRMEYSHDGSSSLLEIFTLLHPFLLLLLELSFQNRNLFFLSLNS